MFVPALKVDSIWWGADIKHHTKQCRRVSLWHRV